MKNLYELVSKHVLTQSFAGRPEEQRRVREAAELLGGLHHLEPSAGGAPAPGLPPAPAVAPPAQTREAALMSDCRTWVSSGKSTAPNYILTGALLHTNDAPNCLAGKPPDFVIAFPLNGLGAHGTVLSVATEYFFGTCNRPALRVIEHLYGCQARKSRKVVEGASLHWCHAVSPHC